MKTMNTAKFFQYIGLLSAALAVGFLFGGCGKGGLGGSSSGGTGNASIKFGVQVLSADTKSEKPDAGSTEPNYAAVDCNIVANVTASIGTGVDTSTSTSTSTGTGTGTSTGFTTGGPWVCTAHTGTVTGVPVSTNLTLTVKGFDAAGTMVYQGTKTGLSTVAGTTTDAGVITVLQQNYWATKKSMTVALGTPSSAMVSNKIHIIGGYTGNTQTNANSQYDPSANTWANKTVVPTYKNSAATAVVNDVIYSIGGWNGTAAISTVEAYDPSTDSWSAKTSMSTTRYQAKACAINGVIYIFGGYNTTTLSTVEAYTPATNTWSTKASMPAARWGYAASCYNGKAYVFGGVSSLNYVQSSVYVYDPSTNAWTTKTSMVTAKDGMASAVLGSKIYLFGGWDGVSYLSTSQIYDPATDTWSTITPAMPTARVSPTAEAVKGKIYVFGGETATSTYSSAVEEFTPAVSATDVAPSAPSGVTVTGGNAQATIDATAVSTVLYYNIYWGTATGVTTATGTKISGVTLPYTHTGLTKGSTYYYIVTAVNAVGESAASTETSVTLGNPTLKGGSMQGVATAYAGTVTTLAGAALTSGSTNATGTAARFNNPYGITTDGTNLYVADGSNHTIRQVVIATGVVTTLAGSALLAGSTDSTGTLARFNNPYGITTDGTNLYVADTSNHTIRKVVISTGVVTTLAGSAGLTGTTDSTGTLARFNNPYCITTDGTNLYVADTSNHTIRKVVISTGVVTTIAGSAGLTGSTDSTGTLARFNFPHGITTDGTNLYVADCWNHTIRKVVISSGAVTTLAGSALLTGSTDSTGTLARFNNPQGITMDGTNLYVTDTSNHTIRKVVISSGVVTTLAGSALTSGSTDATGTSARFNNPQIITTDGWSLYVADYGNHTIRRIQ